MTEFSKNGEAPYAEALVFAARAHEGQFRKGTAIPYITHPVAVSELVARYGGDTDQMIGGLLHDVLEDCPDVSTGYLREHFGDRVLAIVQGCTDTIEGLDRGAGSWRERKEAYIASLRSKPAEIAFVSACDKLHNARAIVADVDEGLDVFARFNRPAVETAWYYQQLAEVLDARGDLPPPLICALRRAVERLVAAST